MIRACGERARSACRSAVRFGGDARDLGVDVRPLIAARLRPVQLEPVLVAVLQVVGEPGVVAADRHRDQAGVGADPVGLTPLAVVTGCVSGRARRIARIVDVLGDRAAARPGLLAALERVLTRNRAVVGVGRTVAAVDDVRVLVVDAVTEHGDAALALVHARAGLIVAQPLARRIRVAERDIPSPRRPRDRIGRVPRRTRDRGRTGRPRRAVPGSAERLGHRA